jgi:diacylglycerol kinase family enzyme
VLFVNPASGGGKATRAALADRARERGISATVLRPDRSLASLVCEAVEGGADTLGIAGGDGSLAILAAAAHAHGLPFVCVPAGTRNHFALDLGVECVVDQPQAYAAAGLAPPEDEAAPVEAALPVAT